MRDALRRVDRSVSDLATSSVLDLSDRYREFFEAVSALLAVAQESLGRGIARPVDGPVDDGWAVFDR